MDGICNHLGHQTLVELCECSNPYYVIGGVLTGSLLAAYVISKISGNAQPKIPSLDGNSPKVKPLQGRVSESSSDDEKSLGTGSAHQIQVFEELLSFFNDESKADSTKMKESFAPKWKAKFDTVEQPLKDRILDKAVELVPRFRELRDEGTDLDQLPHFLVINPWGFKRLYQQPEGGNEAEFVPNLLKSIIADLQA